MLPDPFSSISDLGDLAKEATVRCLVHTCEPAEDTPEVDPPAAKQHKILEARPRHLPIPSANTPTLRGPAPYSQHLTPTLSSLCPHCLAKDRLRKWTPSSPIPNHLNGPVLTHTEHKQVMDTMVHAWEEGTHVSYSAGLLMWHCFCNEKGIPKQERAPAMQALVSSFVVHLAAAYSGQTISGYVNGV